MCWLFKRKPKLDPEQINREHKEWQLRDRMRRLEAFNAECLLHRQWYDAAREVVEFIAPPGYLRDEAFRRLCEAVEQNVQASRRRLLPGQDDTPKH